MIIKQPKTFENLNIVDIKLVIIEHPKTSYKLSNTIRQAEKVGSNSSLYSEVKICRTKKNVKIIKQAHGFKGYVSTYNVEILNSFNPELKPKDTQTAIKNKLKKLNPELQPKNTQSTIKINKN